ncbi:hypothetical protein E4A63_23665, partial [Salmonella enterica subsp. enterica serovar Ank]|nr:hypothetical protein [Salmonella enterica subsp. enterica serovar Ank]
MKYYPFLFLLFSFSSYAEVEVHPDGHPVIYEGGMDLAVKNSDGFYIAPFFGTEYICYNCVIDAQTNRPTGIWHRNLEEDDKSYNPKKNFCSSYNLNPLHKGFLVDLYKRQGLTSDAKYFAIEQFCIYHIFNDAISKVEDVTSYDVYKKITLVNSFQPYVKGYSNPNAFYSKEKYVSDKAYMSNNTGLSVGHIHGTDRLERMSIPSLQSGYSRYWLFSTGLREFISPFELFSKDVAKYYTCVSYSNNQYLNSEYLADFSKHCRLRSHLKIVNNKIYLKDEDVGGGDSGGG